MPVHFGPVCGPRQGPDGERLFKYGPQESTQHSLVYETDAEAVTRYLPKGFEVRAPYIIATHKMHRNLPWLAGKGYNVMTFNVPVTYKGREETVSGLYQLAIWENHADPILSGREQIGYAKVYAEISDMNVLMGKGTAFLSSWGFRFLDLAFELDGAPENAELLKLVLADPDGEGLMHYKYVPRTGGGFCEADAAYVTLTPKGFTPPKELPPMPPAELTYCTGSIEWHLPTWEDMPTQYHIVRGMASLPVVRVIGAAKKHIFHYYDVMDQRIVK